MMVVSLLFLAVCALNLMGLLLAQVPGPGPGDRRAARAGGVAQATCSSSTSWSASWWASWAARSGVLLALAGWPWSTAGR